MLRADILPALGRHRAEAISKLHVMQVVESVAARRSFVAADQVLGLVDSKPIRKRSATRAVIRIASDNGVLDIGTHDLRRVLATGLGEMGVADELIERVLNHAPRTVAGKHYNHAKLFEGMRTALEARSERVHGIVEGAGPVSNVLPLRITGIQA